MWMVRWLLIAALVLAGSLFVGGNLGKTGSINYVFGETQETPLLTLLLIAYAAGFLTWFLVSLFNFFKLRSDLGTKDKLIADLRQELNGYRHQALVMAEETEKNGTASHGVEQKV